MSTDTKRNKIKVTLNEYETKLTVSSRVKYEFMKRKKNKYDEQSKIKINSKEK